MPQIELSSFSASSGEEPNEEPVEYSQLCSRTLFEEALYRTLKTAQKKIIEIEKVNLEKIKKSRKLIKHKNSVFFWFYAKRACVVDGKRDQRVIRIVLDGNWCRENSLRLAGSVTFQWALQLLREFDSFKFQFESLRNEIGTNLQGLPSPTV